MDLLIHQIIKTKAKFRIVLTLELDNKRFLFNGFKRLIMRHSHIKSVLVVGCGHDQGEVDCMAEIMTCLLQQDLYFATVYLL